MNQRAEPNLKLTETPKILQVVRPKDSQVAHLQNFAAGLTPIFGTWPTREIWQMTHLLNVAIHNLIAEKTLERTMPNPAT